MKNRKMKKRNMKLLLINFISTHEHLTFGQFGNFAIKNYCKIAFVTKRARVFHESQVFILKTSYLYPDSFKCMFILLRNGYEIAWTFQRLPKTGWFQSCTISFKCELFSKYSIIRDSQKAINSAWKENENISREEHKKKLKKTQNKRRISMEWNRHSFP